MDGVIPHAKISTSSANGSLVGPSKGTQIRLIFKYFFTEHVQEHLMKRRQDGPRVCFQPITVLDVRLLTAFSQ